jgi:hypothetical protein
MKNAHGAPGRMREVGRMDEAGQRHLSDRSGERPQTLHM